MTLKRELLSEMPWRLSDSRTTDPSATWEICAPQLDGSNKKSSASWRPRDKRDRAPTTRERSPRRASEERQSDSPSSSNSTPSSQNSDIDQYHPLFSTIQIYITIRKLLSPLWYQTYPKHLLILQSFMIFSKPPSHRCSYLYLILSNVGI